MGIKRANKKKSELEIFFEGSNKKDICVNEFFFSKGIQWSDFCLQNIVGKVKFNYNFINSIDFYFCK
jgi:hypothetical protein